MDDNLECSVCLEEFDTELKRPVVGTCGHSFCHRCSTQSRCPECRKDLAFADAPTNFSLLRQIEAKMRNPPLQNEERPSEVTVPVQPSESRPVQVQISTPTSNRSQVAPRRSLVPGLYRVLQPDRRHSQVQIPVPTPNNVEVSPRRNFEQVPVPPVFPQSRPSQRQKPIEDNSEFAKRYRTSWMLSRRNRGLPQCEAPPLRECDLLPDEVVSSIIKGVAKGSDEVTWNLKTNITESEWKRCFIGMKVIKRDDKDFRWEEHPVVFLNHDLPEAYVHRADKRLIRIFLDRAIYELIIEPFSLDRWNRFSNIWYSRFLSWIVKFDKYL